MSSLITHATAGLLYGIFALALGVRDRVLRVWWHAPGLLAILGFASLAPDLDLWIGTHRQTFHNIWVLLVLPAAAVTLVHIDARVHGVWVQPALHVLPGAIASELWYDLFAPSLSGYTEIFWPLSSAGYEWPGQEVLHVARKPVFDEASLLGLLVVYYLVLGLLHRAAITAVCAVEGHRAIDRTTHAVGTAADRVLGDRAVALRERVEPMHSGVRSALRDRHLAIAGAALVHVTLAVVPVVYAVWTGQLVRVSF